MIVEKVMAVRLQQIKTQILNTKIIFLIIVIVSSSSSFSTVESSAAVMNQTGLMCSPNEYPSIGSSKFMDAFMSLMDVVPFQIRELGWAAEKLGNNQFYPMFALGQCRSDLNNSQCYTCFTQARQLISSCIPKVAGRIYLDGCFLRYDNYRFFSESVDDKHDMKVCEYSAIRTSHNNINISSSNGINNKLLSSLNHYNMTRNNNSYHNNNNNNGGTRVLLGMRQERFWAVMMNVTKEARQRKFAMKGDEDVFAMAQCWETLDSDECGRCLTEARRKVAECGPDSDGGRSLFSGCFLRYSTRKFYNDINSDQNKNKYHDEKPYNTKVIIIYVSSALAVALFVLISAVLCWKKLPPCAKRNDDFEAFPGLAYHAGFTFKYDLLEKATNNFDLANKIGQGGAGSVFKGTLPDGRAVAVKRLFFNTRQWTDGFFNEVNLINGIQHKNVVKLLGCSIEGPESLLVYEFVPNGSLDHFLFGKDAVTVLTWEQRFQIICGIAEGLAYLHGGSGSKIIHRDIKGSNILLDENLHPKIADFGLAHCVFENKSHVSTGIAGTLGYMAPEYLMRGQLTEMADVYAFGVLIVEIVCGKKNSVYSQGSTSVLHGVWKNHRAKNITASVDPALYGQFVSEEASNALRAGLLCTQPSVKLRPSMNEVVQILTRKDYVVPSPKQQPFLNSTLLTPDDRTQFSTMSSIESSNCLRSARSSFHTTINSIMSNDDSLALETTFSSPNPHLDSPDSSIQINLGAPEPR